MALYKIISDNKLERCLIFEDDVIWVSSPEALQASIDQLPENFGFFLPGWCGYFNSNFSNNLSTLCKNNVFSSSFHCTHAMVLDHVWAKKLLDLNSERFHQTADGAISELILSQDLTAFVSIPKIFDQDGSESMVGKYYF
jgi:GR25 family glycosyltransferase involved in LPS biosynthesis